MSPLETRFPVGCRVAVRDGKPQPPAHHKRKLREWKQRNFDGTVGEVDERFNRVYVIDGDPNDWIVIKVGCHPHQCTRLTTQQTS